MNESSLVAVHESINNRVTCWFFVGATDNSCTVVIVVVHVGDKIVHETKGRSMNNHESS